MFDVHILAGPTASGKSARALELAQNINGVIINADSLQLYNGLPILTAQPSEADKNSVPHALYGVLNPHETSTAMSWRELALHTIRDVQAKGYAPIVVGGTGFYLKTLMYGLSPIPEVPNEIRIMADTLMDKIGVADFFEELKKIDPVIAERIDPHNRQRLVRAYEVFLHTGKPLSDWQSLPPQGVPDDMIFKVDCLIPERDVLYARCNDRFKVMIEQGAVDEVRQFDDLIMAGKIPFDCTLTKALGFQALQAHVRGEMDIDTAILLAQNETRHYAKRQVTWFRHQMQQGTAEHTADA